MTSIKEAKYADLASKYTLSPSEHLALAKSLGGECDVRRLLLSEDLSPDIAESICLSKAFIDAGYQLPVTSFDGRPAKDTEGRAYVTSLSGWRSLLEKQLGTPKHIRSAHDLVGVHGIVMFQSNVKGHDDIVLWNANHAHLVPTCDFAEARGGTFLWPLP